MIPTAVLGLATEIVVDQPAFAPEARFAYIFFSR